MVSLSFPLLQGNPKRIISHAKVEVTQTILYRPILSPAKDNQPLIFKLSFTFNELKCVHIIVDMEAKVSGEEPKNKHFEMDFQPVSKSANVPFLTDFSSDYINSTIEKGGIVLNFNLKVGLTENQGKQAPIRIRPGRRRVPPPSTVSYCYRGLKNLGNTCYMNTILQVCYHITAIRNILYSFENEGADYLNSIPLNLQNVFYCLETSTTTVSTELLADVFNRKFNLGGINSQQDIHEFSTLLFDSIENEDKSGMFAKLTRGILINQIKCNEIGYQQSEEESFNFLSINLRKDNIDDEFAQMFVPEEIQGYEIEGPDGKTSKHTILKGAKEFKSLPPILFVHLCRFNYCNTKLLKINSVMRYDEKLDLTKYAVEGEDGLYTLFGVIVHSGTAQSGHYFCYLNIENQWHKLEDSFDKTIKPERAFEWCYGNNKEEAYILIYIKNSAKEHILYKHDISDIPPNVKELARQYEIKRKLDEQLSKQISINLTDIKSLIDNKNPCLLGFKQNYEIIRVDPETTKKVLYQKVEEIKKYPVRLWKFSGQKPTFFIEKSDETIDSKMISLLVQEYNPEEEFKITDNKIIVYCKFFDYKKKKLYFNSSFIVDINDSVSGICNKFAAQNGFSNPDSLLLFIEREDTVEIVSRESTFKDNRASNSSIFIFQEEPEKEYTENSSEEEDSNEKGDSKESNIALSENPSIKRTKSIFFYLPELNDNLVSTYLSKQQQVNYGFFKYHFDINNDFDRLCALACPNNIQLNKIKQAIAKEAQLDYDPTKQSMILFKESCNSRIPLEVWYSNKREETNDKMSYYVHIYDGVPEKDLSKMQYYSIQFSNDGLHSDYEGPYLTPKLQSPKEILEELKKRGVNVAEGKYRASRMSAQRLIKQVPFDEVYKHTIFDLRIERIPESQEDENCKLSSVSFVIQEYNKDKVVGFPFWFNADSTDPEEVKAKLASFLREKFPELTVSEIYIRRNTKISVILKE